MNKKPLGSQGEDNARCAGSFQQLSVIGGRSTDFAIISFPVPSRNPGEPVGNGMVSICADLLQFARTVPAV